MIPSRQIPRQARFALAILAIVTTPGCRGDGGGPVGPDPVIAGDYETRLTLDRQ